MKKAITVDKAIDSLQQLDGQMVEIEGVLNVETDRMILWHSSESQDGQYRAEQTGYRLCIQLATGNDGFSFDDELLGNWHAQRVAVIGVLHGQDGSSENVNRDWVAKIEAYTVVLISS